MFADPPQDSFPLSTYPMFSHPRSKPWLFRARGMAPDRVTALEPSVVANDDVLQAAASVRQALLQGPEASEPLCHLIAERVAKLPHHAQVTWIELVSEQHDPIAYFEQYAPDPLQTVVHMRCEVHR